MKTDAKTWKGYIPEWVARIIGGRNFLEVALDVRMTATGAFERHADRQEEDISVLKWRVENWVESIKKYEVFDNAVRQVLVATIFEVEMHRMA